MDDVKGIATRGVLGLTMSGYSALIGAIDETGDASKLAKRSAVLAFLIGAATLVSILLKIASQIRELKRKEVESNERDETVVDE